MELWAEVYDASGNIQGIASLVGASVSKKLDSVGQISLTIPAGSDKASLFAQGRRVLLYVMNDEVGNTRRLAGQGVLNQKRFTDGSSQRMLTWSGDDMLEELRRLYTYRKRNYDYVRFSHVIDDLMLGLPAWDSYIDGAYGYFTGMFHADSIWKALLSAVGRKGLHVRLGAKVRELEIGAFGDLNPVRLISPEYFRQEGYSNRDVGLVETLELTEDGAEMFNWVEVIGGSPGSNYPLTLQYSRHQGDYAVQTSTPSNGERAYYLADSTSIAAYGTIQKLINLPDVIPANISSVARIRAEEVLHEWGEEILRRHKDPVTTYRATVRKTDRIVLPGDTIKLLYQGSVTHTDLLTRDAVTVDYVDVDDNFWVTGVTEQYSIQGRTTVLDLSSVDRGAISPERMLAESVTEVRDSEAGIRLQSQDWRQDYSQEIDRYTSMTITFRLTNTTVGLGKARLKITRDNADNHPDSLQITVNGVAITQDINGAPSPFLGGSGYGNQTDLDILSPLMDVETTEVDIQDTHTIVITCLDGRGVIDVALDIGEMTVSTGASQAQIDYIVNDVLLWMGLLAHWEMDEENVPATAAIMTGMKSYWSLDESASGGSTELLDNLIGYWELNETSGTRTDAHAALDLTDNNTVGNAAGKQGNAAAFVRANTEYLSHADSADFSRGDTDFMFVGWVYLDNKTNTQRIWGKYNTTGNQREYLLQYNPTPDRFQFLVSNDGTANVTVSANTFGSPSATTWYFIVVYHDAVNNLIGISINNGSFDTTAHSTGIYNATSDFTISNPANVLDGRVDELGFWGEILTGTHLTWLYNSGNGRTYADLSTYGGTAVTRADSHGSNNLTDNNSVTSGTGKQANGAVFVRANTEYLSHADSADFSPGDTDFGFGLWVKLDNKTNTQRILAKWAASNQEYLLQYDQASDRFTWSVSDTGSNTVTVTANTFGSPSTATWYFIVVYHDAANNLIGISINNGAFNTTSHSAGVYNGNAAFTISSATNGLDGMVDEAGYWSRMITAGEITTAYNSGDGRSYSGLASSGGATAAVQRNDSRNNYHLTDNNTIPSTTGKHGRAASFERANGEYFSQTDTDFARGDTDWAISAWVLIDNKTNTQKILGKWGSSGSYQYVLEYYQTGDRFRFGVSSNGTATAYVTANTFGSPSTATLYFITVWHDSVNNQIGIRVNASEDTAAHSAGVYAGGSEAFKIGDSSGGLDGDVDEVSFWTIVPTAAQREWLYHDGLGRRYASAVGLVA